MYSVSRSSGAWRVFFCALLLSNLRTTWIASRWSHQPEDAILPPRLSETWGDKLADQLPMWLWPRVRILYYLFSAGYLGLVAVGYLIMLYRAT